MSQKERLSFSLLLALVSLCSTAQSQFTWRASVNYAGEQANDSSGLGHKIDISADGRYVVYLCVATNMLPGGNPRAGHVYRFDRLAGTSELASIGLDGSPSWGVGHPSISADGRLVSYNYQSQIYVRDLALAQTEQASVTHDGQQPNREATSVSDISPDGRYVVFTSLATNLVAAPPVTGAQQQVYVRDRLAGTTILVSQNSDEEAGNEGSGGWRMRGHQVMFFSHASNLVPENPNHNYALYVKNLDSGVLEVLIQSGEVGDTDLSDEGRYMVYRPSVETILLRDRLAGTDTAVNVAFDGSLPNGLCFNPLISADGRFVTFLSLATNLLPPGMPAAPAVQQSYVRDMFLGRTMLVSPAYDGNYSHSSVVNREMAISARFVAFQSDATDLILGDTGTTDDIFLRQFTFDCETPRIAAHPIAPVVCEDRPITLTVNAVGSDLQYQWSLNGVDIPGATAAAYSVEHVDSGDAGLYLVRVYNDCGPVFSQVRVLVLTDMNENGLIDLADLATLLSHFGSSNATYADGDLDGDGTVALADLTALLSIFGQPCP